MAAPDLDLSALVRNRTLSPEVAALFEAIGQERRSFVVFAVPRMAGKSTVMRAILECAPPETELHTLDSTAAFAAAGRSSAPGYLVIPEVAPYAVMPGYLWGEPVRRAFALLDGARAMATGLHAPDAESAFRVLSEGNGVADVALGRLEFAIEIRSLGAWQAPSRRVVSAVHQVRGVREGVPVMVPLHRWVEAGDRFEAVEAPEGLRTVAALQNAASRFAEG